MILTAENLTIAGRLQDVSCMIEEGRITAICGPNGAGKSTLLAALAGLLHPDNGSIAIDGDAIATLTPRQRAQRIGYLPQIGEVAWDVTVRNLIALGRLPYGDEKSGPVEAALAALDLEELADRPVSQLSGGERARALLARVLAGEPKWLLADEPLAALDLAHQIALARHFRRVAAAGVGVVLVVHDLALAMNHADRVIVLDEGELVGQGTADTMLSPDIVSKVWSLDAEWLGDKGIMALSVK